jgi:hypothetical protein
LAPAGTPCHLNQNLNSICERSNYLATCSPRSHRNMNPFQRWTVVPRMASLPTANIWMEFRMTFGKRAYKV